MSCSDGVKAVGGLFQIAGVATVAIGIHLVREKFAKGRPGLFAAIGRSLTAAALSALRLVRRLAYRLVGRKPPGKHHDLHVHDAMHLHSTEDAVLTVQRADTADKTTKERVALLEAFVDMLAEQLTLVGTRANEERRERQAADEAAAAESRSGDEAIRHDLIDLAVGGIVLQQAGLVALVLGIALATWPEWIATYVLWC